MTGSNLKCSLKHSSDKILFPFLLSWFFLFFSVNRLMALILKQKTTPLCLKRLFEVDICGQNKINPSARGLFSGMLSSSPLHVLTCSSLSPLKVLAFCWPPEVTRAALGSGHRASFAPRCRPAAGRCPSSFSGVLRITSGGPSGWSRPAALSAFNELLIPWRVAPRLASSGCPGCTAFTYASGSRGIYKH